MDRGAWQATVHWVEMSQTRLSDWACMDAHMVYPNDVYIFIRFLPLEVP